MGQRGALKQHTEFAQVSVARVAAKFGGILTPAWAVDADIWSSDRDFAGIGVATWSTPNPMRGLAAELVGVL